MWKLQVRLKAIERMEEALKSALGANIPEITQVCLWRWCMYMYRVYMCTIGAPNTLQWLLFHTCTHTHTHVHTHTHTHTHSHIHAHTHTHTHFSQQACTVLWNLSLPLLQRSLSHHLMRPLTAVATALEDISRLVGS